jgi:catechol 2,3-dioxygenase-like lactoylglutathione lyase family enzyme
MIILGVRIELFVNDVEHSARFYREVLGFRPERDVDETGYLAISSGALTIGLQGHAKLPSDHHFRREHFADRVESESRSRLRSMTSTRFMPSRSRQRQLLGPRSSRLVTVPGASAISG